MRDMDLVIPKAERRAAFLSFWGLVLLTAVICAMEFSTRRLQVREYLIAVALAATSRATAGTVLGLHLQTWADRRAAPDCHPF